MLVPPLNPLRQPQISPFYERRAPLPLSPRQGAAPVTARHAYVRYAPPPDALPDVFDRGFQRAKERRAGPRLQLVGRTLVKPRGVVPSPRRRSKNDAFPAPPPGWDPDVDIL